LLQIQEREIHERSCLNTGSTALIFNIYFFSTNICDENQRAALHK